MATSRTAEATRSGFSIPEDLFSSTKPSKKKPVSKAAASLIKTPQYARVLRRQAPPVTKISTGDELEGVL
jgi:hypothetical protein